MGHNPPTPDLGEAVEQAAEHSRRHLYAARRWTDRVLHAQQRFFGALLFGPLYVALTVWWVLNAVKMHIDNPGLTIYTFGVSVLAIYMSWVVTNILNRQGERDRQRDDVEASEVSAMFRTTQAIEAINQRQMESLQWQTEILKLLRDHITADHATGKTDEKASHD